eukprot:m.276806 g.276806  ORF g.276806 m.276806 type:complete len:51 (+) comp15714_c2_seq1:498-650(+)
MQSIGQSELVPPATANYKIGVLHTPRACVCADGKWLLGDMPGQVWPCREK